MSLQAREQAIREFNHGVAFMEQYRPADAVAAFEKAIASAPGWTTARLNLGIALLNDQSEDSLRRAEQELSRVLADDPGSSRAHYSLGMLFRHQGRLQEARSHFEQALSLAPNDADSHFQAGSLAQNDDPAAARRHLERTLELEPYHESACYQLQMLLRRNGELERADELLARFNGLRAHGAGKSLDMSYGQMGRLADVVHDIELPDIEEVNTETRYENVADEWGVLDAARGANGWLQAEANAGDAFWGPGVAVADVDSDGDLDVCITGIGAGGGCAFHQSHRGKLSRVDVQGFPDETVHGAFFGDYDGDGDVDLYLTRTGPNRLYRNEGNWRFTDVTEATGTANGAQVSVGATWADADHDGDLDLYVTNVASVDTHRAASQVANALLRNNGDGSFTDLSVSAGVACVGKPSIGSLMFDADGDFDLDLLVLHLTEPPELFQNERLGRYQMTELSQYAPMLDGKPAVSALAADIDGNGRDDLLLLSGQSPAKLILSDSSGTWAEDQRFTEIARGMKTAENALAADVDLDGDLDLILLNATIQGEICHCLITNHAGGWSDPQPFGPKLARPSARGAVAADLDGDGALELIVGNQGRKPEVWRSPPPPGRHWLTVLPQGGALGQGSMASPPIGAVVEAKTGARAQRRTISSTAGYLGSSPPQAVFGLGRHSKCDYVRLVWPDGTLQSELEISSDQAWSVTKFSRKASSCPVLFAWNGERFAFVTDMLGGGGLGFFTATNGYAPPDPTENVRIEPSLLTPRDGRYQLRVVEPLEEVSYIDQLRLLVFDHPSSHEVYPDERFGGPPTRPGDEPICVTERILPRRAIDEAGRDVLEQLRERDRACVDVPTDPRFVGFARDHWIELDFDDLLRGASPERRLYLVLHGWVEYTYSHVNYAAQQAGVSLRPLSLEVPDGEGGWRVALIDAGFPAGMPRTMTIDVTSLGVQENGRLRLRTNMCVYWDQVFAAVDEALCREPHSLPLLHCELRYAGYPREYSPDGREPAIYDYERRDASMPFRRMTGRYTRYGDVRALLFDADDQMVIFGSGDELVIEFDASRLPELPPGYVRTAVLSAVGYCKDMDLYTAFPRSVAPLPWLEMDDYPPRQPFPDEQARDEYERTWNTRRVYGQ